MTTVKSAERCMKISDEVLAKVAALAARDTDGVAALGVNAAPIEKLLVPDRCSAVEIENLGGAIAVCVRIRICSGCRAVTVAKQVQQNVKQSIQDMTGVTAVNVSVEVSGVVQEA